MLLYDLFVVFMHFSLHLAKLGRERAQGRLELLLLGEVVHLLWPWSQTIGILHNDLLLRQVILLLWMDQILWSLQLRMQRLHIWLMMGEELLRLGVLSNYI